MLEAFVIGLSLPRHDFYARVFCVGFVVKNVALG